MSESAELGWERSYKYLSQVVRDSTQQMAIFSQMSYYDPINKNLEFLSQVNVQGCGFSVFGRVPLITLIKCLKSLTCQKLSLVLKF